MRVQIMSSDLLDAKFSVGHGDDGAKYRGDAREGDKRYGGEEEREGDGIREQEGARKLGNGYTIQQKW